MTYVPKKIAVIVGAVLFLWIAFLAIYYLALYIFDISW